MFKKYLSIFIVQSLVFMIALGLLDWASSDLQEWYSYVIQGLGFGLFMTLYSYWTYTRKKNKEKEEEDK